MKFYLTPWDFHLSLEFICIEATELLLTALSHLLCLSTFFLSPSLFLYLSPSVALHLRTFIYCMASTCCLFLKTKQALFHKHTHPSVLLSVYCHSLSVRFVYTIVLLLCLFSCPLHYQLLYCCCTWMSCFGCTNVFCDISVT